MEPARQRAQRHDKVRSGTALRRAGKETVARILEAARRVLIVEGGSALTMRRVAEEAGVTHANVQYYFPKRDDLIHGLFRDIGDHYNAALEDYLSRVPDEPLKRLTAYVRFFLEDTMQPDTRRFFIQLWSVLANTGDGSGRLLGELYERHISKVSVRVAEMYPDVADEEIQQRAILLAALIEGLAIVMGPFGAKNRRETSAFVERALSQALEIAAGVKRK